MSKIKCNYCRNEFPKNEFRIKNTHRHSPYCLTCRDSAEIKEKVQAIGNVARALNTHEHELIKKFVKKLTKKQKKEKLPISLGADC